MSTRISSVAAVTAAFLLAGGAAPAQEVNYSGDYFGRIDLPLPQAFSHLKRLIGDADNFEPITKFSENNRYRVMAAPIGRLDLLVDDQGEQKLFLCTGWLIAIDLLMTNHHCIPGKTGKLLKAQLVMNYLEEGAAQAADKYPVEITPVETSKELDYSVVRVQGNPGDKYKIIDLRTAREPVPNEEMFVIQHPAGTPKRLTRRNCRVAENSERPEEINHFCDTLGGSSGSPVFSDNDNALLGIHFAGIERKINFAKRMTAIIQNSRVLSQLQPSPARAPVRETPPAASGGEQRPPAERAPAPANPAPAKPAGGLQPIF